MKRTTIYLLFLAGVSILGSVNSALAQLGAQPFSQPVGGCPSGTISITSSATSICQGTSVTFTASTTATNGGLPILTWFVNGAAAGGSNTTYTTSTLSAGSNSIHCQLSFNASGCAPWSTNSNTINVTVSPGATVTAPSGTTPICQGGSAAYTTTGSNASSYNWSVSPSTAATITGTGSSATVAWNSGYSGTATLSVAGVGCSGASTPASTSIVVNPSVGTPSALTGSSTVCQGATVSYTTAAANATSYNWTLNGSAVAGSGASNSIALPAGLTGAATIAVTANGCNGPSSAASANLTVNPSVASPAAPSGSTSFCQGSTSLTYTTGSVTGATGYVWSLTPSTAGSISGTGTSGVVTWNSAFSGAATIGVATTGCNASGTPVTTAITVTPTVGAAAAPSGPLTHNEGIGTSTYSTTASNASGYSWTISPSGAGSISGSGVSAVVTWNPFFTGSATISVAASGCNGPSTSASTTVAVYIALGAGVVTPAALNIASGADPGLLTASPATGGNCNGGYAYQWQRSADGVNFSLATGTSTGENYDPGVLTATAYFRRRVICGTDTLYTNVAAVTIGTGSGSNLNYIRTRTIVKPLVTDTVTADGLISPYDVQQTTQYLDGLGRPIQTVTRQISPLGKDMVQPNVYDPFGREVIHYLPYVSPSSDGNYKPSALSEQNNFNSTQYPGEQFYYGQTNYEASPLNRTLTTFAPGSSWVGNGHGLASDYEVNALTDSVAIWNIAMIPGSLPTMAGFYPAAQLYKNVTTDENGHQVVEYKDKEGQVVLKKVQSLATPGTGQYGWLCTYYVYDNVADLRFVISPRAVELINTGGSWTVSLAIANELCFRYEYDSRNRMSIKKIPGAGETHMVYDERDRLVMTQDSMMRSNKQWLVTTYDGLNRPDSTGLMTDPGNYNNQAYHANLAMQGGVYPPVQNYAFVVEAWTHYDDYNWVTALNTVLTATMDTSNNGNSTYFITNYNSSPSYAVPLTPYMITRGMSTGTTEYLIGSTTAMYNVDFYDDHSRLLGTEISNYLRGVEKSYTQYDFSGKPLRKLVVSPKIGSMPQAHTAWTQYSYDAGFRLTSVKDDIDNNGLITVDTLLYNELGQLRNKTLGGGLDSLVYDYNIRGWTTGINKNYVAGTSSNWFGMELGYDKQTSVSTTTYAAAQYNGNITGLIWKSAGDGINRKYDFQYDTVGRLAAANFQQNPSGSTWNKSAMDYTVNFLNYDANGNILGMNQYGFKVGTPTGLIDELAYHYQTNSNKLSFVIDQVNDTASTLGDFHYKTKGSFDYLYDANGNLTIDNNKGIDSIGYNFLNLPQYIHIKGKGTIQYAYNSFGLKQAKIVTDSTVSPVKTNTTVYIQDFQYTNDTLTQFNQEEGRIRYQKKYLLSGDSIFHYYYDFFEKDHLGNTRVILTNQKDTAQYMATMEAAYRAKEMALFYNIDSTSYAKSLVPGGYPTDNTTVPNDSVARVSGSTGSHTMGPALLLKVMSGDSVGIGVKSYYVGGGSAGSTSSSLPSILNALANGLVAAGGGGGHGTLSSLDNTSGSPVYAALNSFLPSKDSTPTGKPKAYLNWMLLDNQFNYVSGNNQSGAIPVGNANVLNTLATNIKLQHSGYLYIWVSNETQNWDVFLYNQDLS